MTADRLFDLPPASKLTDRQTVGRRLRDLKLVKQRRVKAPAGDTYMVWVDIAARPTRVVRDYDFPAGF